MASERIMSTINDGGSAFPCGPLGDTFTGEDGYTRHQFPGCSGMSLRDWFAGQESLTDGDDVEVVMSTPMAEALAGRKQPGHGWSCATPEEYLAMLQFEADWRAALRYIRADAMLKAREEKR